MSLYTQKTNRSYLNEILHFSLAPVLKRYAKGIRILKEHSIFFLFLRMKNKSNGRTAALNETSENNSLEINAEHGPLLRGFMSSDLY